MPYIKTQKIVKDKNGVILSGSAAIIDSEYITGPNHHTKKHVRERLGKVLFLAEDKRSGIFLSPTRGMTEYDSCTDTFSEVDHADRRLSGSSQFPEPQIHTIFGDTYLLLEFMKKCGLIKVFRTVFSENELFEKVIVHTLHDVLYDQLKTKCNDFLTASFVSYLFQDLPVSSLRSDCSYYSEMGDDSLRVHFFREFVKLMEKESQKENPYIQCAKEFGKGCYVDSTPLPNEIRRLMSNAYCSHGTAGSCLQTRMFLVLDDETDLPAWYGTTPGNVLDLSTINTIISDTYISVGVEVDSLVLDAGYLTKEFLKSYTLEQSGKKTFKKVFIGKSPRKRGFHFQTLYEEVKPLLSNAKYELIRNGKIYFAYKKKREYFGNPLFAYIYLDEYNALNGHIAYIEEHETEYQKMTDKEKNWNKVQSGFFILISNIDTDPAEILERYITRVEIEKVFKTGKDYTSLLPLAKWTKKRVDGKLFSEMISTLVILLLRKKLIPQGLSLPDFTGKPKSQMCFKNENGQVIIETPNKQVKELYQALDIKIPDYINLSDYLSHITG